VIGWDWVKSLFEGKSYKQFRASRRDLHENRQEMQRSISTAMEAGWKSSKALDVAERALRMLEKNRNEHKQ
jgi:isoaspartyl peptidase/L-asparaginase-like protein (Ntn-hydrolase superfamily)